MSKNYSIESLREISEGDEEFIVILAKTFLEEIPQDLIAMEEAVINNNKELAYHFALKMKPNLEMFGLNLGKDITSLESWTKSLKSKKTINSNMENITTKLYDVFDELKEDYNL